MSKRLYVFAIFFVLFFLPGYFSQLIDAASYRSGVMISLFLFVILSLIKLRVSDYNIKIYSLSVVLIILILLTVGYVVSSLIYTASDHVRFILSLAFLFLFLYFSALFVDATIDFPGLDFHWCVRASYWLILIVAVIAAVLSDINGVAIKSMFFFNEPSHFSLLYTPLLCYVMYNSKRKIFHFIVGVSLSLVVMNLTMLFGVLLCGLVSTKMRFVNVVYIVFASILTVPLMAFFDKIDYFTSRLTFGVDSTNLSALVFMSGWERAYLSLIDSKGFGVGFQQMGINGPQGYFMEVVKEIYSDTLNKFDGGTLGSKLVAETGVLGVMLLVLYVVFCVKLYRRLHFSQSIIPVHTLFYASVVISSLLQVFVRGVGYFSPFSFLFVAGIYYFVYTSRNNKVLPVPGSAWGISSV
jgi:hypothetical protein